ncbi:MAG: DUF1232 domain-containing protein [Candidatus Marinimicrobia bacterium]|jgi:uncharacterized membrane protein YkvA (DUF1232 family)|nr:DUF1232 domain-containing protein [Candidatus Neomarinimicrobiota bacterium]MBT3618148.1 DUF1232 domain-containing protein [Candidatus Neomarinimicrobiota bacterium]MBT3828619.1 DUF1232 domain-containing protein [Candidatus Neomarinimicrobiota bacterium]MBT3996919.1 DUF1232 domain-containing protein [Candidatus Neomarinimicrobiota bacterium]MBT4280883.1 DUF1232 domain-containing protein [Candidatus Neomarinimicrobiota bacterium]
MNQTSNFHLTDEDKAKYLSKIDKIDLTIVPHLIKQLPEKFEGLLKRSDINTIEGELIRDVSKLIFVLENFTDNISEELVRKIAFSLTYFLEEEDEIPDSIPEIGLLDDAVVVRWIVDEIIKTHPEYFVV